MNPAAFDEGREAARRQAKYGWLSSCPHPHSLEPESTYQQWYAGYHYELGLAAKRRRERVDSCPYPPGTEDAVDWRRGWWDG